MIWQFASRYFLAKKSTQAINVISWVSMIAIAVGAAALIIVLSVFNGFEDLVKSLYSSFYPSVKASPFTGKTILVSADKLQALQSIPGVTGISEVVQEKGVLRYNNEQTIAVLMGVDTRFRKVAGISGKIIRGEYNTGTEETPVAVIGAGIEAALGVDVSRSFIPMTVYMPGRDKPGSSTLEGLSGALSGLPQDALRVGQINPVGTFAIQQDFDNQYVITNIQFLRKLMGLLPNEVSALEFSLSDTGDMEMVKNRIQQVLGDRFLVQTRYEQNRSLYNVMQAEKWAVYIILSFILIIAAFNMVGSLSMLVIEKEKDISILKAMGIRNRVIRKIFLAEGMFIAVSGAVIGIGIAVMLCVLQQEFGFIRLQGGTFVVSAYPVSMHASDFLLVFLTILMIAWLASWYPALRASRQPVALNAQ